MNRVDTWLSAQRGWRLLLVRCAALAPLGLAAGSLWSMRVTLDPATPQMGSMAARMALCLAASFVLAAFTLAIWRGRALRPGRTRPTWRMVVGLYAFSAGLAVAAYEQAEPPAWKERNANWVFLLQLALIGVYFAMNVWNGWYASRLRRRRDDGGRPTASSRWASDVGPRESL